VRRHQVVALTNLSRVVQLRHAAEP